MERQLRDQSCLAALLSLPGKSKYVYPQGLVSFFAALSTMEAARENKADDPQEQAMESLQVLLDVVEHVEPDTALSTVISYDGKMSTTSEKGAYRVVGGGLPIGAGRPPADRRNGGSDRRGEDDDGSRGRKTHARTENAGNGH